MVEIEFWREVEHLSSSECPFLHLLGNSFTKSFQTYASVVVFLISLGHVIKLRYWLSYSLAWTEMKDTVLDLTKRMATSSISFPTTATVMSYLLVTLTDIDCYLLVTLTDTDCYLWDIGKICL